MAVMISRLDKAKTDLFLWRASQETLLKGLNLTPETMSIVRAVDAAFKSEVLEYRILATVNSQALNEAAVSHVPPHETLTGIHRWDFDWWLTEVTMRALHAGIDALAQLLNVVFEIGIDRGSKKLPLEVVRGIAARDDLCDLFAAVQNMQSSSEYRYLRAFVNHVKHNGFPERSAQDVHDCLSRAITIEQFRYESNPYGPWTSSDVKMIIDGFRRHVVAVIDAACHVRKSD